jgi:hypothetical protein
MMLPDRRPAASHEERRAAFEIRTGLAALGYGADDVEEQPFPTATSATARLALPAAAALVAAGLGRLGRFGRLAGSVLALGAAAAAWRALRGLPGPLEPAFARASSWNLGLRVRPGRDRLGVLRARAVLLAPLDSPAARLTAQPVASPLSAGAALRLGAPIGLAAGSALLALGARHLAARTLLASAALLLMDLPGRAAPAPDRASGARVLLALARRLAEEPPAATEVWLVFTGAAAVGHTGLAAWLEHYGPLLAGAPFVALESGGARRGLAWALAGAAVPLRAQGYDAQALLVPNDPDGEAAAATALFDWLSHIDAGARA